MSDQSATTQNAGLSIVAVEFHGDTPSWQAGGIVPVPGLEGVHVVRMFELEDGRIRVFGAFMIDAAAGQERKPDTTKPGFDFTLYPTAISRVVRAGMFNEWFAELQSAIAEEQDDDGGGDEDDEDASTQAGSLPATGQPASTNGVS